MKYAFRYITVLAIILQSPGGAFALSGGTSVIETIYNALPAIVEIQSEAKGLYSSPPQAVKDARSGRIAVARSLKAASYKREGAGAIIDADGIIVTNAHIVKGANRINIKFNDGRILPARILSVIEGEDIAFLQIDSPGPFHFLPFADSSHAKLRSRIFNVGASDILSGTFTEGMVTGLGEEKNQEDNAQDAIALLQTSFNVYKGDSGGPVLDAEGNLLGIISAARQKAGHTTYAITSNKIKRFYQELK